jgi:hypothetical protein
VKKKLMLIPMFVTISMATGVPGRMVNAQGGTRQIEVTATRFAYTPSEITLKKMTLTLRVVE